MLPVDSARRCRRAARAALLAVVLAVLAGAAAGCGGSTQPAADGGGDGSFALCTGTPAAMYMPGLTVHSRSGAFQAEVTSVQTEVSGGVMVDVPAVGISSWTIVVSSSADSDAGLSSGADPQMTAEKPYMPLHMHGASVIPDVTDEGGGRYTVGDIGFFMAGYWQVSLDVKMSADAQDTIVFEVCVPS